MVIERLLDLGRRQLAGPARRCRAAGIALVRGSALLQRGEALLVVGNRREDAGALPAVLLDRPNNRRAPFDHGASQVLKQLRESFEGRGLKLDDHAVRGAVQVDVRWMVLGATQRKAVKVAAGRANKVFGFAQFRRDKAKFVASVGGDLLHAFETCFYPSDTGGERANTAA